MYRLLYTGMVYFNGIHTHIKIMYKKISSIHNHIYTRTSYTNTYIHVYVYVYTYTSATVMSISIARTGSAELISLNNIATSASLDTGNTSTNILRFKSFHRPYEK